MSYLQSVYDVTAFGAVGDGINNDSPAVQAAFNAVVAAGFGTIYFPRGRYRLNAQITATFASTSTSATNLAITGDGQNVSILQCNNSVGVISITFTNTTNVVRNLITIADIGICTEVISGTALNLSWGPEISNTFPAAIIRNIGINPDFTLLGNTYFSTQLKLTNQWSSQIIGCNFRGPNNKAGTGLEIATTGESESNPLQITDCQFYCFEYGIKISGFLEGVTIKGCTIVNTTVGVFANPAGLNEHLVISDSHIAATSRCVQIQNIYRLFVHDCVFFMDYGDQNSIGVVVASGCNFARLQNVYIRGYTPTGSNPGANGIVIAGSKGHLVANCAFVSLQTGCWLQSSAENSVVTGNRIFTNDSGSTGAGTVVIDSGVNNQVYNNF